MSGGAAAARSGGLAGVPILAVWSTLGGGDLRRGRGRAFWRDGDGLNISVDAEKNVFFDNVMGTGGGILDLVQTARGCDRREALRWLEQQGFIDPRETTPAQRRAFAEKKERAQREAESVRAWHRARCIELERLKTIAVERDDLTALQATSFELWSLQSGSASEVLSWYRQALMHDPNGTRARVAAGRSDFAHCARVAALTVRLLALAEAGGAA